MWLDVGSGKIHYDKFDPKAEQQSLSASTPIFILPGMGSMTKDYHPLAHLLCETHTTLIMTYRDIAPTTAVAPWTNDIRFSCDDIIRILDQESITKAHFVGESYGGMLALGMALYYPDRVQSLSLINSSIAGERILRMRPKAILNVLKGTFFSMDHYRTVASFVFSGQSPAHKLAVTESWLDLHKDDKFPQVACRKQLIAAAKFHPQRQLKHLKTPCLIIYGENDTLVSPANSLNLHRLLPDAEVKKVNGGGHLLCYERSNDLAKLIKAFTSDDF